MPPAPTRILLIDSHELTRIGIRVVLQKHPEFIIVGEADDQEEVMRIFEAKKPDLVLVDTILPNCGDLDICRSIRNSSHAAKLFLISSCDQHQCMIDAFTLGVDGYLLKDTNANDLVQALRDVIAGKTVLAPSVAEQVVEHMRVGGMHQHNHQIDTLSVQERRVLELVAKGKSNRQVADALGLSEKTVKNYFSSVLSKLSANRRTEAAAMYWNYAQQTGIANPCGV